MFKEDQNGGIYYLSDNNIQYSLLEGIDNVNRTSDILFIFREPTEEEIENTSFCGEVVDFVYGGFDCFNDTHGLSSKDFVEERIKTYERKVLSSNGGK